MDTTTPAPHKHADQIKAWADNPSLKLEYRPKGCDEWLALKIPPSWHEDNDYRAAPAAPAYPETRMKFDELCYAAGLPLVGPCENTLRAIANAALRHAVDAKQVITMKAHAKAVTALGQNLRGVEIDRHAGRDMAIAEAVRDWYRKQYSNSTTGIVQPDLPHIISQVKP